MRAIAIPAALAADRAFGDPSRFHPVALFGSWATFLEKRMFADSKAAGGLFVTASVVPVVVVTRALERKAPTLTLAVTLWAALGGRTLEKTASALGAELESGDVEAARTWIPWLCSRDPQVLDGDAMARAAVESVAENTSDAAIAPLFWAMVSGAQAVVLHRCVNTLDAMVGYRNDRYQNFGFVAAKLDDVLAYAPARLTALSHIAWAVLADPRRGQEAVRAWREDAPEHPSPNAGPVEATAAAALGVQLGGPTQYPHGIENRPKLGTGSSPRPSDVRAAVNLARRTQLAVGIGATLLCVLGSAFRRARR